jgi:inorganic pyrophosphatase/exopolyphosphatase
MNFIRGVFKMPKSKTYKNKKGNIKIKVTKNDAETKVLNVEDALGNSTVEHGKIQDLKLTNEVFKFRTSITSIADNSTVETHSSPGCFWYFFAGQWWRICI